jgi:galactose mutarotase-like enzyme
MMILNNGSAQLGVSPYRGAATCFWKINGKDIFYVDQKSLKKKDLKFVGGNPVMFPIFSSLGLNGQTQLRYDGFNIQLPQHGLARLSTEWRSNLNEPNQLSLYLSSSAETLRIFPWDFILEMTYTLGETSLTLEQKVINTGNKTLPFVAGFHPYFQVSDPKHCELSGLREGQPCYFVSNYGPDDMQAHLPSRLPLGTAEVNHHFDNSARTITLKDRLNGRRVSITPHNYPCATIWSEPGRPFVCIEPVTGRRGAFESRENLVRLPVGECWQGKIVMQVEQL